MSDNLGVDLPPGVDPEAVRRAATARRRERSGSPEPAFSWRDHAMTAADLRLHTFRPVSFVVPGLIPEGLCILAGRPKVGKSWAALDIALAVAGGTTCLGDIQPEKGDVLYAALEDNQRRLQWRIDKLMSPFCDTWPERLTLTTRWQRLDKGGVEHIGEWADSAETPRLVILDTLERVRPVKANQGYSEDYEALAALHRLANDRGLGVLLPHHTRKADADDPLDTVSGTLGLAGCADTIAVIARNSKGTTLYIRGRDIEEAEHAVQFDKETCRWTILGSAAEIHRSQERNSIIKALRDGEMNRADLAETTSMKPGNLDKLLHQMFKDGEVSRTERGVYALP